MTSTETDDPTETDRHVTRRRVQASPSQVFALLTDPTRHQETEPTDWVGEALDPSPLTRTGQVFGMNMFHVAAGGAYLMHNEVVALEPDRTVAWRPGQYDEHGVLGSAGWTWRYDLTPDGDGTMVTLTYDWSAVPDALREEFNLPPFGPDFLEQSLDSLEQALERS